MTIRSGHAGHWYAADRSGEGWVLELRDGGGAWLYWFTYDEQGRQRWLTAAGQIVADGDDGQRIDFPQLVVTRGARFGAAFDPADVVREAVGSARLRFDGCDSGEFSYDAFSQSQTFAIQRLARVMGTRCETPHGVTGREVADHAGQSGSWYDPAHNGEGYALHWATPDQAIVTWYSYDGQGNQYWMLGTGQRDALGKIHFADVHATRGARFGAAFDSDDVERFAWGELTFQLACDGGSAQYQSVLPAFGNGEFELTRLTSLHEVACPWQRPTLADLYDIDLMELSTGVDGLPGHSAPGNELQVAGDGTLWTLIGLGDSRVALARLRPGDVAWSMLYQQDVAADRLSGLHLGSELLVVTEFSNESPYTRRAMVWREGSWTPLDSRFDEWSHATAVSVGDGFVVGYDAVLGPDGPVAWRWSADEGVTVLPEHPDRPVQRFDVMPRCVSPDGSRIVGLANYRSFGPFYSPPRTNVLRWLGEGAPVMAEDAGGQPLWNPLAFGNDCATVFGVSSMVQERPASPDPMRWPWYWLADGRSGYLRPDFDQPDLLYRPQQASADGTVLVGIWGRFRGAASSYPPGTDTTRKGWLWTPLTGVRALSELPDEVASILGEWLEVLTMALTQDGRRVVLVGTRDSDTGDAVQHVVAVELLLRPKW